MLTSGHKLYLYTKTRAIFSRFASVEAILAALNTKNISQLLKILSHDGGIPQISGLLPQDAEHALHGLFVKRLSQAIPPHSELFPLFRALVHEYETLNISIFLKHGSIRSDYWYPLAPGCGSFNREALSLTRDNVYRLLENSVYREVAQEWRSKQDPLRLDSGLKAIQQERLKDVLETIPRGDRRRIKKLNRQKLSLSLTIEALRMQRNYKMGFDEIVSSSRFDDPKIKSEILDILKTPRFEQIEDALPSWVRPLVRNIIALRADAGYQIHDPELDPSDLAQLEKLTIQAMLFRYRQEFRVYGNGHTPFYCFYHLFKRELYNLMLLLNGIRFNIAPDVLKSGLVW